jgi:hypothetical protein
MPLRIANQPWHNRMDGIQNDKLQKQESYELISLVITPSKVEIQAVISKTESLKENDILRFIKTEHEELIAVITSVEQYDDVTILGLKLNPKIVDSKMSREIKEYNRVEFFGSTIDE